MKLAFTVIAFACFVAAIYFQFGIVLALVVAGVSAMVLSGLGLELPKFGHKTAAKKPAAKKAAKKEG